MDPRPCGHHSLNSLRAPQTGFWVCVAVGWGCGLLRGKGGWKSSPPPLYRFPAKTKRGAGRTRSGICSLLFPCGLRRETGDISFRLFLHFLPPFLPSVFLSQPVFLFLQYLCRFSLFLLSGPQSLCLPGILPSSPKPGTPLHPTPAPPIFRPGRQACAHVALSLSAFSHVLCVNFSLCTLLRVAGLRAVVRAGVRLSVCLPAG